MAITLKKKANEFIGRHADLPVKWLLLAIVVAIFTVLFYPSLKTHQQDYQLGDIADRNIKALKDFFVEDKAATEVARQQIVEKVPTIYDHDPRIAEQIKDRIHTAFSELHKNISTLDGSSATAVETPTDPEGTPVAEDVAPDAQEREKRMAVFREAFGETLGIEVSQEAFQILTDETTASNISEIMVRILTDILANGVVANKDMLLKELEKGIIIRNVATQTEKTVYALRQYYGPDQAKTMVRIVAEPLVKDLNYNEINLVVEYCQQLMLPNITLNRNETEKRKTLALDGIKPIMYKIKAGEMVLREGERVSSVQLLKLQEMNRQADTKPFSTSGIGGAIMVATLLITSYMLFFAHPRQRSKKTTKNLVFLSITLSLVFVLVKLIIDFEALLLSGGSTTLPPDIFLYVLPIAAAPMLVSLIMGFDIALMFSVVAAISVTLLSGSRIEYLFFVIINHTFAAYWVQNCRERKKMVASGLKLGLLSMFLSVSVGIFTADHIGTQLIWDGAFGFLGGLGSSIIALGLAPLVEIAFGYTTDITLLELANLDRPILKRLMIEAPGTYHHSMVVGSLVEAAASEIGANPLLAKVSAYYHDIGKVKKPPYFIENQTSGRNKHDKLAPSMSSLILIAHVKDGVEIAKEHKLGKVIIDIIQQHHGTSLISFFYEKAKQLKGEDAVKIDDFRYPGPRPQTKEAGLVMLADVVEAASRTLENPTPARIQGLVQHLINKVFSDGQLDNCELTLRDLHLIAKSFNKILYGIHHHRIEYGDAASKDSKEGSKSKDGNSDRQSTGKTSNRDTANSKENQSHLKRLGLS